MIEGRTGVPGVLNLPFETQEQLGDRLGHMVTLEDQKGRGVTGVVARYFVEGPGGKRPEVFLSVESDSGAK